ncbi:MAG TPA: Fe-S cluster assembly protein SufD [Puia sp.]|jgi:Fe-S cluster assembly protein SufD|nr:Fe-S cluster assembly protein SufD [Puia sp.]
MSTIQDLTIPLYEEIVNGYNKLVGSDSDLRRARQSAFDKFRLLGFPSIKNEDWKYTNIGRFLKDEYALAISAAAPSALLPEAAIIQGLDGYRVVLVNGVWNGEISGGPLPVGMEIKRVAEAVQDPTLAGYFENGKWGNLAFPNLNTALFTDGLFIRVNGTIDKPLQIIHLYSADRNLMIQPRHVWVVNANAELTVVESVFSAEEEGKSGETKTGAEGERGETKTGAVKVWVNSLTEIIAQIDSRIDHTLIQAAAAGVRLVNHTTVRQKKQSLYNNYTFTLPGADLVRNDLQARLEEDHTETHLYGLYLTAGQQLVDNHTLVDHQKPSCFSNELYKGVLLEQSTGVFNGKVFVHKDAQKTNAFQQNNNLVISKKATIDSKPELEIFADDVKCSHGSTVGQFSEDALFYLRARGIGEETAKALLIAAFAFDVTEKIKVPAVENYINQLISQHIPVQG